MQLFPSPIANLSDVTIDENLDMGAFLVKTDAIEESTPSAGVSIADLAGSVGMEAAASDDLRYSDDTLATNTTTTYTKKKEMEVPLGYTAGGTFRVKFDFKGDNGNATDGYSRIYKNGVAFGTERSNQSATFVTYSEDLEFSPGDLIQVYIKAGYAGYYSGVQNFRIYCADTLVYQGVDESW